MTEERSLKLDSPAEGYALKVDAGGALGRVERTPQGGIKVPANLTTHGIFEYRYGDKVVREFRSPEEVAKLVANGSLESAPVTDDHPYADRGVVTPDNFSRLAKGHGVEIKADGAWVAGKLVIQDKALINKVDAGTREVSLGIRSRDIAEPGVWEGKPYDVRQTDLVANHIAIVPVARVKGSAIKLDSSGLPARDDETRKESNTMLQIKIDGTVYPLGTDAEKAAAVAAQERYQAKLDAQAVETKGKIEGLQGKLDAALEEAKQVKAKLDAATDPKTIEALLTEKAALRAQALKVLGSEAKLDGLTDTQIRTAVVAKAYPALKLDGKGPEYLAGLFDSAVATFKADAQGTANTEVLSKLAGTPEVKTDGKSAKDRMHEHNRNLAEQPLAYSKK